ncbi:hypothetical protein MMC15_001251 [Xylographa vitiligo]|nr:hypothetical protein [Xylographa vitiligo]
MSSDGAPLTFADVAEDVVLIAVKGVTGSGKSTFIKRVTGSEEVVIGKDLTSCTKKPSLHKFTHDGAAIVLIDTPGFDDTFLSDGDVLQEIAACLELTYKINMKLTGIIYMHRIVDPRMNHGGMRNLAMFRKLCGPEPMKNVVLATSFWSKVTEEEGLDREHQLRTNPDFWAEMIEEGAQMARIGDTKDSCLALVERMVHKGRIHLQIQIEMCDDELPLAKTQAGEQVNGELAEMARKHAEELLKLQQDLQDAIKAADQKLEKTLKRELTKSEKKLVQMQQQQEALKADRRNEIRVLEQEFDRRLRRVEAGKKEEADTDLKAKLARARRQDRLNQAQPKKDKKKDAMKYLKIAGVVTTTALSIAHCVVNPFAVGSAVTSVVHLVNLFFSGSDTVSGDLGDMGSEISGEWSDDN